MDKISTPKDLIGEHVLNSGLGTGYIKDVIVTGDFDYMADVKVKFDDKKSTTTFKILDLAEEGVWLNMSKAFFSYINLLIGKHRDASIEELTEYLDLKANKKTSKTILVNSIDDEGAHVTLDSWKAALSVADEIRYFHERRAVIADENTIFINAAAAARDIGERVKDGDRIYQVCEGVRKSFSDHLYRYATKKEIQKVIDEWN